MGTVKNVYLFPYAFRDLTDHEKEILGKYNKIWNINLIKLVGSRSTGPERLKELGQTYINFKPRPDDIWLVGSIRSGTTLTQEILYLLGTNLDYEKSQSEIMDVRFPELQKSMFRSEEDEALYRSSLTKKEKVLISSHRYLEETKEKRFIKSHYGFNFLHPELLKIGCKVVFIARNPKDLLASLGHYPRWGTVAGYEFKDTWERFKNDLGAMGNYFEMLEEAWERKHNKNLLILFYEEVNADKKAAIIKIADFLGTKLTDSQLETLLKHVDIDNFRNNKSVNNDHLVDEGSYAKNEKFSFIRKGKNGGWRESIPEDLHAEIDEWVRKNFEEMPDFQIPECWREAMGWN